MTAHVYREMEQTPPAKPPRREWALARMLRQFAKEDDTWFWTLLVFVALPGFIAWAFLAMVAMVAIPFERNDRPPPVPADVRCIRSHGRWNAGEVDGNRVEWCTWGPR